jgi:hypothetical protein
MPKKKLPDAKKKLPAEVLEYFKKEGAKGGRARKRTLSKEQLSEQGRKAVLARWAQKKKKPA